jgi:hypothetical protein
LRARVHASACESQALAVLRDASGVPEEGVLPVGLVGRRRARLIAVARGEAEAEALKRRPRGLEEGLREHARHQVLRVVGVGRRARSIGDAVHGRELVLEHAFAEVPLEHHAEVAVGSQLSRKPALDECERRRRLETLEAERGLELAALNLREREVLQVDVSVLQRRRRATEVRHDPEVDVLEQRAFDVQTRAPQCEGLARCGRALVGEGAAVGVQVAADAQAEARLVG